MMDRWMDRWTEALKCGDKYFSYFSQKIGLDISYKLSPCMKYQSYLLGKLKKNTCIMNLSSAEFARQW